MLSSGRVCPISRSWTYQRRPSKPDSWSAARKTIVEPSDVNCGDDKKSVGTSSESSRDRRRGGDDSGEAAMDTRPIANPAPRIAPSPSQAALRAPRRRAGAVVRAAAAVKPPESVESRRSSMRASPMSRRRWSGSLVRQRSRTSRTFHGVSFGSRLKSGSPLMMSANRSVTVSP